MSIVNASARAPEPHGKPVALYVSPDGSDASSGTTKEKPLASLAKARDLARSHAGKDAVTVHVADGMYYLPETLVFSPEDSGSAEHPIVYRAEHEGGAVLSGGSRLSLDWKPYRGGIFQAKTPEGLQIDQLFVNGAAQRMARYPNYDPNKKTAAYQGCAADAFSKERAANWADPAGGYIHAVHAHRWGGYHYRITGKDAEGNVTYEGGWQNNRQMGMHKNYRMVENIFEELDAPGEWFHRSTASTASTGSGIASGSRQAGTLYYMPEAGTDLDKASVEVVRLRHLVEFKGSAKAPVKHIRLQGFTVRHAARTFMDCREPLLRSDWAIYRGGAFLLTGTEDVSILDCEFDQVGGNAVFVNNYNRRVQVAGCHIHDAGASGVCFVGDPKAVRDPLFEYNENNDLSKIDQTPGPKTDNYPADSIVEDCLIHGIGRVERQPAGVQISMAQGITVRDVSIYDCARSGINISEGTWGGHLIEGCDVFDTVLETSDHGSFNSWGRDRFWHLRGAKSAQLPELSKLDAVETTVIRNSRWRCDHGWDIDLDDGSSNYDIYNNLLLASGLKLREGFRRHAWNNVMVNNGLHPHVWYEGNKDQVYANIMMGAHRPARIKRSNADGARVDENLFFVADEPKVKATSEKLGWDKHSIFDNPQFIDPASGDFRVKDGSPALALGFKNFPMDQFGVKKPALKKIARTPQLPTLRVANAEPRRRPRKARPARASAVQSVWLGATLQTLSGEEFSAYGVAKEDGGVVLTEVPKDSEAARGGLEEGDVVQQVNGTAVRTSDALLKACAHAESKPVTLKIVREQQAKEIALSGVK
ncbi:MAG: PDZ domain-containing protein [Verrucomicrobia bacterium]|nr:PDZ domain-containing protein [Verrucomicrobiota bacterium]